MLDPLIELALKTGESQAIKRVLPIFAEDLVPILGPSLLALDVGTAAIKSQQESDLNELCARLKCNHLEMGKLTGPVASLREILTRRGCGFMFNAALVWHPQWDLDVKGLVQLVYRYNPSTKSIVCYDNHTFPCRICFPETPLR